MLDCETMKTYANSKNGYENRPMELSHPIAETHGRSYTPLRPILLHPLGEVHGIA